MIVEQRKIMRENMSERVRECQNVTAILELDIVKG